MTKSIPGQANFKAQLSFFCQSNNIESESMETSVTADEWRTLHYVKEQSKGYLKRTQELPTWKLWETNRSYWPIQYQCKEYQWLNAWIPKVRQDRANWRIHTQTIFWVSLIELVIRMNVTWGFWGLGWIHLQRKGFSESFVRRKFHNLHTSRGKKSSPGENAITHIINVASIDDEANHDDKRMMTDAWRKTQAVI